MQNERRGNGENLNKKSPDVHVENKERTNYCPDPFVRGFSVPMLSVSQKAFKSAANCDILTTTL